MKTGRRTILSVSALVLAAALAGYALYYGCGGGSAELRITAVDMSGNPLQGIAAKILGGTSAGASGTTDSNGKVSLTDSTLPGSVGISLGSITYRNYTIYGVQAGDVAVTLNELNRAAGFMRISIEDSTWGALVDDPLNNIYRVAFIMTLFDDITDVLNITGCPACIRNNNAIVPGRPDMSSLVLPGYTGTLQILAAAGLIDWNNSILTLFKAGAAEVALDLSNTCDNLKAVSIPLTSDLHQETAVTLTVSAGMPQGTTIPLIGITDRLTTGSIGVLGITANVDIGGEKLADNSYRFRGLMLSEIAEGSAFFGTDYISVNGFSNEEGAGEVIESLRLDKLPLSNEAQALTVDLLLPTPQGLSPSAGSTVAPADGLPISWGEASGASAYFVTLGTVLVNGTVIDDQVVWQGLAPAGTTSMTVPTADDTFPGLTACQAYRLKVHAIYPTGFEYGAGVFPQLYDLLIDDVPSLFSTNSSIFFTSGTGCGPLITIIWPFGSGAGTEVTISGANFGDTQGTSTVSFGGTEADQIQSWSANRIVVKAPAGAIGSTVAVNVTVGGAASNSAYYLY